MIPSNHKNIFRVKAWSGAAFSSKVHGPPPTDIRPLASGYKPCFALRIFDLATHLQNSNPVNRAVYRQYEQTDERYPRLAVNPLQSESLSVTPHLSLRRARANIANVVMSLVCVPLASSNEYIFLSGPRLPCCGVDERGVKDAMTNHCGLTTRTKPSSIALSCASASDTYCKS